MYTTCIKTNKTCALKLTLQKQSYLQKFAYFKLFKVFQDTFIYTYVYKQEIALPVLNVTI
jgi:hypothetical protein